MRLLLPTFAILSLLVIAVLIMGCFVRLRATANLSVGGGGSQGFALMIDGGRLESSLVSTASPGPVFFKLDAPRIRLADAKRSLWEFHSGSATAYGFIVRTVQFPVWVGLCPCMVAPGLWLRRNLRKSPRGFEVTTGEG